MKIMTAWTPQAFPSPAAIPSGFWRWPHFSPEEMADGADGRALLIVPAFMDQLEGLRLDVGFPLPITSAYRSADHDKTVGGSGLPTAPHVLGLAVDIGISANGPKGYALIKAAFARGFPFIEAAKDHIHLDWAPSTPHAPRPAFYVP